MYPYPIARWTCYTNTGSHITQLHIPPRAPAPQTRDPISRNHQPDAGTSGVVELAEVFRQHGSAYRAEYGQRIPPSRRRAMRDIENCRTEVLGGHIYICPDCEQIQYSYHGKKLSRQTLTSSPCLLFFYNNNHIDVLAFSLQQLALPQVPAERGTKVARRTAATLASRPLLLHYLYLTISASDTCPSASKGDIPHPFHCQFRSPPASRTRSQIRWRPGWLDRCTAYMGSQPDLSSPRSLPGPGWWFV